jgi:hypothetical protein
MRALILPIFLSLVHRCLSLNFTDEITPMPPPPISNDTFEIEEFPSNYTLDSMVNKDVEYIPPGEERQTNSHMGFIDSEGEDNLEDQFDELK